MAGKLGKGRYSSDRCSCAIPLVPAVLWLYYSTEEFMQGSKSSEKLLEAFAEKLAETFVQGDLYIGDWSTETGAEINVTSYAIY